jgi:hypothetical protein
VLMRLYKQFQAFLKSQNIPMSNNFSYP